MVLIIACSTYDTAIIYHKNFQSGSHSFLRFDGYYIDTLGPKLLQTIITTGKPFYFYANGSSFSGDQNLDRESIVHQTTIKTIKGSWGNYLINVDTIILEKFQQIENNNVRIILKGIIYKDRIKWFSRKFHKEPFKPVDYSSEFRTITYKPDSTQNFTRNYPPFNK